MLIDNYYKDADIKIQHSHILHNTINDLNVVGASDSLTLRSLDFSVNNSNAIFVSQLNGSDTNSGTIELPVKTISKALTLFTGGIETVVVNDNETYELETLNFSGSGLTP